MPGEILAGAIANAFNAAANIYTTDASIAANKEAQEQDYKNNLELAKYNNEYNKKFWYEMQDYNSPASQRARLEEAGLNPNYQSIDSGNVSNSPVSTIPTNLSNKASVAQANAQLRLQAINARMTLLNNFVNQFAKLSGIPKNVGLARDYAQRILENDWLLSRDKHLKSILDAWKTASDEFGVEVTNRSFGLPIGYRGLTYATGNRQESLGIENQVLRNENLHTQNLVRQLQAHTLNWDFHNLKPMQVAYLRAQILNIGLSAKLNEKQLKWFTAKAIGSLAVQGVGSMLGVAKMIH